MLIQATYWVGMNVHVSGVLKERGLDESLLGVLYPVATIIAIVTNIVVGRILDWTDKKELMRALGTLTLILTLTLTLGEDRCSRNSQHFHISLMCSVYDHYTCSCCLVSLFWSHVRFWNALLQRDFWRLVWQKEFWSHFWVGPSIWYFRSWFRPCGCWSCEGSLGQLSSCL